MRGLPILFAAVLLLQLAMPGQQAERTPPAALRAVAPAAFATSLGPALARELGVPVEVVAIDDLAAPPADAAVWLVDEWTLSRWVHDGAIAPAASATAFLPFAVDHVLLGSAELGPVRTWTWQELALSHELHDRLYLPDAKSDGGPWAAMLRDGLLQGLGHDGVVALWTTADARRAAALADAAAAADAASRGALSGWIAASGPTLRTPLPAGFVRHPIAGSQVRLGVGLPPAAVAAWRERLDRLDGPALTRLAAALGVEVAAPSGALLPGDLAAELWTSYTTQVRGRGRQLEELADGLDLGFALASLAVLLVLWRVLRRSETGNSARN
jgi:hypothetical protein